MTDAVADFLAAALQLAAIRGVARNLIWGVYVSTSHCNFKTYVNVPHHVTFIHS